MLAFCTISRGKVVKSKPAVQSQPEFCCSLQTKGVPIEEVSNVVRSHWLWRRVAYKGGIIPPTTVQVVDGVPVELPKHEQV